MLSAQSVIASSVCDRLSEVTWWSRGVAQWFRWSLSVADPFVCRCLTSSAMLRFHTPLIEPDVRICRIRLSEKTHAIAEAIACDAVCNFSEAIVDEHCSNSR